jgi:hypothetical protein
MNFRRVQPPQFAATRAKRSFQRFCRGLFATAAWASPDLFGQGDDNRFGGEVVTRVPTAIACRQYRESSWLQSPRPEKAPRRRLDPLPVASSQP